MIVPIFSGGVGRSGTTVIGDLFKNHTEVFVGMPYEVKFITELFGLVDFSFGVRNFQKTQITTYGQFLATVSKFDTPKMRFVKFKKMLFSQWWDKTEYNPGGGIGMSIDKTTMNKILDEFYLQLDSPIEAARNFTFNYIKNHKDYSGQKYWIDTSPANIMYADLIYRIFPETKFIEMRRNPLDNIGSVLKQTWGPNNEDFAIKWWSDRIKKADSAIKQIPQNSHMLLTLEDLIRDDRDYSYNKLCSLIGISNNQTKVIEYFNNNLIIKNANFDRWKNDFTNPINFKNKFDNFIKHSNYNYKLNLTL